MMCFSVAELLADDSAVTSENDLEASITILNEDESRLNREFHARNNEVGRELYLKKNQTFRF